MSGPKYAKFLSEKSRGNVPSTVSTWKRKKRTKQREVIKKKGKKVIGIMNIMPCFPSNSSKMDWFYFLWKVQAGSKRCNRTQLCSLGERIRWFPLHFYTIIVHFHFLMTPYYAPQRTNAHLPFWKSPIERENIFHLNQTSTTLVQNENKSGV